MTLTVRSSSDIMKTILKNRSSSMNSLTGMIRTLALPVLELIDSKVLLKSEIRPRWAGSGITDCDLVERDRDRDQS